LIFLVGLAVLGSLLMLTLVDVQSRLPLQPATSPSAAPSKT
jgi:hypothetical protein